MASDITVKIWCRKTGLLIRTLEPTDDGHHDIIMSLRFSPNSTRLATAGMDKTIIIWNYVTGAQLIVMRGHEDVIYDCKWTRDGNRVFTSSFDKLVKLWQVNPVYASPPNRPSHSNVYTNIHKHRSRLDLQWKRPNANGKDITGYVIQRQIRKQTEWGGDLTIPPSSRER